MTSLQLAARSRKAGNKILTIFVASGSICLQTWKSELICIMRAISTVKRARFGFEQRFVLTENRYMKKMLI